jgi:hypothetical protein
LVALTAIPKLSREIPELNENDPIPNVTLVEAKPLSSKRLKIR